MSEDNTEIYNVQGMVDFLQWLVQKVWAAEQEHQQVLSLSTPAAETMASIGAGLVTMENFAKTGHPQAGESLDGMLHFAHEVAGYVVRTMIEAGPRDGAEQRAMEFMDKGLEHGIEFHFKFFDEGDDGVEEASAQPAP